MYEHMAHSLYISPIHNWMLLSVFNGHLVNSLSDDFYMLYQSKICDRVSYGFSKGVSFLVVHKHVDG